VLNKTEEMDIFKSIWDKITEVDTDRKTVEATLLSDVGRVMTQFEEFMFNLEQNQKAFNQLTTNVQNCQ
jgi:hypothetical protein